MAAGPKFIQKARGLTDQFVIVPNAAAQDKALSWKARGLLVYLLSLPEDWVIRKSELDRHSTDGRESTHTAFNELVSRGYVDVEKVPGNASTPPSFHYFVFNSPLRETRQGVAGNGKPTDGSPAKALPDTGNPSTTKETSPKETSTKKTSLQNTQEENSPAIFESELFLLVNKTFSSRPIASPQASAFKKLITQGGGAQKCLNNLLAYVAYKANTGELTHNTLQNFVDKDAILTDWNSLAVSKSEESTKQHGRTHSAVGLARAVRARHRLRSADEIKRTPANAIIEPGKQYRGFE